MTQDETRYKNLKPFKKGQSGNPKGLPKGTIPSKVRLRRLLDLTSQMKNPVTGEIEGFSVLEQMDLALILKARKGDVRAYNAIVDRLEGKAPQNIKMDAEVNQTNRYEGMTKEDLDRAREILNQYQPKIETND